jgi:hypothetical protein
MPLFKFKVSRKSKVELLKRNININKKASDLLNLQLKNGALKALQAQIKR